MFNPKVTEGLACLLGIHRSFNIKVHGIVHFIIYQVSLCFQWLALSLELHFKIS